MSEQSGGGMDGIRLEVLAPDGQYRPARMEGRRVVCVAGPVAFAGPVMVRYCDGDDRRRRDVYDLVRLLEGWGYRRVETEAEKETSCPSR